MDQKPTYGDLEQKIKDLETDIELNNQFMLDLINIFPDLIFVKDEKHRWVLLNDAFCSALGYQRKDLIGKTDYDIHTKEQADIFWEMDDLVFKAEGSDVNEEVYTDAKGEERTILTRKSAFKDRNGKKLLIGISHDVTKRKRIEKEREKLVEELQEALTEIKTLRGILPICSKCKKIRDDKGYWNQIESYIQKHSEVQLSHGICPECAKQLYGDLYPDHS